MNTFVPFLGNNTNVFYCKCTPRSATRQKSHRLPIYFPCQCSRDNTVKDCRKVSIKHGARASGSVDRAEHQHCDGRAARARRERGAARDDAGARSSRDLSLFAHAAAATRRLMTALIRHRRRHSAPLDIPLQIVAVAYLLLVFLTETMSFKGLL